jgi:serine/threonine protein kinase
MIETGKILQQRYRIQKQIGQGGMGAVYVATDERFSSTVAIKETLVADEHFRRAFEREARLLNSLKHPALPRVSDHFEEDNGQFLVMEYIPGEDLSCTLEREEKPFGYEQVLVWADQLLDALEFLHSQSSPVVHRDIKPQNLKVTPRGQIVLLDFGLAKGNPTDAGHQTAAKSIFGYSRNYASLEQIQGTGTDPRSDLYSLAATLYHLLTYHAPEDALTRAMAVLAGRPDPLVPANAFEASIPAGVAGILQKSLDLNADGRPATAAEMRQMFREYEKYGDLAVVSTTAVAAAGDVHAQVTKLMPGTTRHRDDEQTNIKTKILPTADNDSIVTSVRPLAGITEPNRRGFARQAAFAVFGLLIACAVGLGAYRLGPSLFGEDPAAEQPSSMPSALPPADAPVQNSATAETNANPAVETVDTVPAAGVSAPASKPKADTQRTARSVATPNKRADQADAGVNVDPDVPSTIYVGNMKIVNGRIETPNRVVDGNGVRMKRLNTAEPPIPPFFKYLKPEDQRKLVELRRRGIIVDPPVKPEAKPSPQPNR